MTRGIAVCREQAVTIIQEQTLVGPLEQLGCWSDPSLPDEQGTKSCILTMDGPSVKQAHGLDVPSLDTEGQLTHMHAHNNCTRSAVVHVHVLLFEASILLI